MSNSWWRSKPAKKSNGKLTAKDFDNLHKVAKRQNARPQPFFYTVSPRHELHKWPVAFLLGLRKIPTKRGCPLCKRIKQRGS